MSKTLRTIRNYFCYCGIEKEEFKAVKKDAYVANFETWRVLHIVMDLVFGGLFLFSITNDFVRQNEYFYLAAFIYSAIATVFFFILDKKSIVGQLIIYLSISVLFLFGCFITQNKPNAPAITFITFLLISPLFMIDKPYFMSLELIIASTVFLIWMHFVKEESYWRIDLMNTIIFTFIGIMIHILVNSMRIKEFVLIREINRQKDMDELTGVQNKAALTKGINEFFVEGQNGKGILFVLDVDYFKSINDTYGHGVGDEVLKELGQYLKQKFVGDEIVGRFGGDEFIIFIKGSDDVAFADSLAKEMVAETSASIKLPTDAVKFSISLGIAIYHGEEKNYSEIFKKADIALYKTKADRKMHYCIYKEQ